MNRWTTTDQHAQRPRDALYAYKTHDVYVARNGCKVPRRTRRGVTLIECVVAVGVLGVRP